MKKWSSILAVVLVMCMAIPCMAEGIPSITTTDTSRVVSVEKVTGEPVPDTFVVEVTEDAEPVIREIEKLYSFVNDPEKAGAVAPIDYFDADVQTKVREQLVKAGLPEDYDLSQLALNEFITIREIGYESEYGDVVAKFEFDTEYQPGQKLVGLIGFYTGAVDENGEYLVEWDVVPMEVLEDGSVAVTLSVEQLVRFSESAAVALAVLSEPMPETAAN